MSYQYEDEAYGGRILWGRFAFWAAVIVVAFVLGRFTAPGGVSQAELEDTRAELTQLAADNVVLQDRLDALSSGGTDTLPPVAEGPEPTDEPDPGVAAAATEAPQPSAEAQTYTVQPGDTVNSIASEFYDDLAKAPLITAANGIADVHQLQVGQVLTIPDDPEA